jgi:hypothetical protein
MQLNSAYIDHAVLASDDTCQRQLWILPLKEGAIEMNPRWVCTQFCTQSWIRIPEKSIGATGFEPAT